jgi:hypothetical protein
MQLRVKKWCQRKQFVDFSEDGFDMREVSIAR